MRGSGSQSRAATRSQSGSRQASRHSFAGRRRSTWLPQSGWRRSPGSRFRSSPTAARASWCCSSGSASSLTSPVMADERQLRFLIAAGGTVGHVAPALAVAEALRRRGGLVTFAGSPDRGEARLVPEHGYEFDAFAVSGLPRRPSRAFARAAGRALAAPVACRAILRRRKPDARVVLVFGGSLGARLLNDLALDAWADAGPAVIHLCGERDYPELQGQASRPDYILEPFIEEIGVAYGAADVVLARAGGSVWELAAAGLPAVLVPGAFATGQHPEKNARWFADAGGAVVVPEAEAARAPRVVEELLGDADRLAAMAAAMRAVAKPDAAEEIADELVSLAAARR